METLFTSFDGKLEPWIYTEATEVEFDGCKMLFVPWICDDNRDRTMKKIESTDAQVLMGHLEVKGFTMYKGLQTLTHGQIEKYSVSLTEHSVVTFIINQLKIILHI